ncbi:hypothetical protein [Pararobbsia silviterrae]|uniref:hypothetical protein n=1 Tax=Pararobbsia silviterrae TaxID=1792498 RepID=UPI001981F3A5|nr:hypothetical protein [Pararobbsia silviterrae]
MLAHTRADIERSELTQADTVYATAFCDYRSADGYFRKYRMIFVDRKPYPYHLAISDHWLVHYVTADMLPAPWKLEEERAFLKDPAKALGTDALATLENIAKRLDLDYAGIDFSLMPDGRVLVFESNATMLVHPEPHASPLAYKNTYVDAIVDAFAQLIESRRARH